MTIVDVVPMWPIGTGFQPKPTVRTENRTRRKTRGNAESNTGGRRKSRQKKQRSGRAAVEEEAGVEGEGGRGGGRGKKEAEEDGYAHIHIAFVLAMNQRMSIGHVDCVQRKSKHAGGE